MKWNKYFDAIYIINLPHAITRRHHVIQQMAQYEIDNYSIWPAIENENNPAQGLTDTIKSIFTNSLDNNYESIMIFEDDVKFLEDPTNTMKKAMFQLPKDWMQLYMGVNPASAGLWKYSDNLLGIRGGFSAHAVAYSKSCMQKLSEMDLSAPIDLMYAKEIHPIGLSFVTKPFLASQRAGYSYIEKRETNYKGFLEDRYDEAVKKLNDGK